MSENKEFKIDMDSLEEITGGFMPYAMRADEQEKYRYLMAKCNERGISNLDWSRNVDTLTNFCRQMKAKYGSIVDPGNLLG